MDDIWEQLSKPLPPDGPALYMILTNESLNRIVAKLERCDFVYRSEGRANVVYSIVDGEEDGVAQYFGRTLLRVPKTTPGAPEPCSYDELQHFREEMVEPLVGREHVVPQILLQARSTWLGHWSFFHATSNNSDDPNYGGLSTRIAERLNAARISSGLSRADGGQVLPGPAMMLIQDMGPTPRYPLALEFKPKWLAQSPLAPDGARRCRSCAREAKRNRQILDARALAAVDSLVHDEDEDEKREEVKPPVCRLGLVHSDAAVFKATVDALAPDDWSELDRKRLAAGLRRSGVLERLRELQVLGDPLLPGSPGDLPEGQYIIPSHRSRLFVEPSNRNFGLSMTLRDCSCFVLMKAPITNGFGPPEQGHLNGHTRGEGTDDVDIGSDEVIIKLADVDKKNWVEKQEYWQDSHTRLIHEGWYHATEQPPIETHCLLQTGGE